MGADQWIAMAALLFSVLGGLATIMYRLGQMAAELREVTRRVGQV